MNVLIVVSQRKDWPCDISGVTAIAAEDFLTDPGSADPGDASVYNLCRTYAYQSHGYYVSLLAEARGQRPFPDVQAIKQLQAEDLSAQLNMELGSVVDCAFARTAEDAVELDIFFGQSQDLHYQHLGERLFKLVPAPLLHASFERRDGTWRIGRVEPVSPAGLPAKGQEQLHVALLAHLKERKIRAGAGIGRAPAVAILRRGACSTAPSNREALRKFAEAGAALGMRVDFITENEASRIGEYDALFLRDTTHVDHYTYELARRASAAGMVVIDDPESILRCTNKIYLYELLSRHKIPVPKTLVVHKDNVDRVVPALGLPCILKQPDGAFSLGVVKIESEPELREKVGELLQKSELLLAQAYLPTEFDWRVAVLDGRPLFVCKYYMAPGHWQVIKHDRHTTREGRTEAFCIGEVPNELVNLAVAAANLIGDGFYGVDLKQIGTHYVVIEINDNPNVDAGNEDAVLGDALYREVMGVFRKRIDSAMGGGV